MASSRSLRTWTLRILAALLVLLLVAAIALVVWAKTGVLQAENEPWEAVQSDPAVTVQEDETAIVLSPADTTPSGTGLVFYAGAKVEAAAYAERLSGAVTEAGLTVVIVKPWLNLALFDQRGLDTFTSLAPELDTWIVGGHSLGGVRACQVADDADALLLLAAYCAGDVDPDLPVLSLSGSEDELSTPDAIAEATEHLPDDARMVEIPGANHASFGDYGPQDGDGTATISTEEMTEEVTSHLAALAQGAGQHD